MMEKVLLIVVCLAPVTSAWFWSKEPDWNGLRVTFGLNPFSSNVMAHLPRERETAENEGWKMIADCDSNGLFRGARYMKDNDPAVILLFDKNGYIAGIQCGLPKNEMPNDFPAQKQRGNIFQDDGDRFTLTAYFTDPGKICTDGRSATQFESEGTGTTLYIQNGSDPVTQSILIPNDQSGIDTTKWTKGKCFWGMGLHYWYSTTKDMDCDDFQPVFLLYNKNKLNAFGWALRTDRKSKRFEHPPKNRLTMFMDPVPDCLHQQEYLSTMHIYFTKHPMTNRC